MVRPSVTFELSGGYWVAERQSVGFTGKTDLGEVEFLITSEALEQMLNPDLDGIDGESALEIFAEFEADIHRIAVLEFVKRLGGEPPILLAAADVETH
ncbi:MAG: hypothetical protein JWN66_2587 [Sphingomonas bacterium]|uniref:DUF1488 family protein n=1 Tax=Sphingomonas bacterium TaxID=1895847 RepID=UPI00260DFC95|nr:DUF1488 family protein [Sphingomonas bacterium]MDB5705471.1 hypothetical protein [Sphingomonas bacterium]